MLTKERAKQVVAAVVAKSKADEVHVTVGASETTHLRFARNTPSTSGNFTNKSVSIRSTFGSRSGAVSVNQVDDATLADAVARSEAIAKLAPKDPETMPGLGPQSYAAVDAFEQSVLDRGAEQLARGVATCIDNATGKGLVAAGFGTATGNVAAMGNSRGNFGYHRSTSAHFSQTVRTKSADGSGWAAHAGLGVGDIDFAANSSIAIDKAVRSAKPQALEPGKYVTILEPACVANLVAMMVWSMNARSADEGRSYFSKQSGGNRIGEKLFGDVINIHSDPTDANVPGRPWGDNGLPQVRRGWIENGTLANLAYGRYWAKKSGVAPVPRPSNVIMAGGSGTTADLVKSTKRGVLITSLWYIRSVDPRTMLFTGLTRDGVFLIENGEITKPLTNFRWNDSPIAVLKGVEAMSASARVSPRSWRSSTVMVPALRVKEFELSSVSEAV